jgi:hypothetical protein
VYIFVYDRSWDKSSRSDGAGAITWWSARVADLLIRALVFVFNSGWGYEHWSWPRGHAYLSEIRSGL